MSAKVLGVEGLIAVGKSYLCREVSHRLGYAVKREDVPEHFLTRFYAEPKRYALSFQLRMFYERWYNWRLECELARSGARPMRPGPVLMDRTVYGDLVFATANYITGSLQHEEYRLYVREFRDHASRSPVRHARFLFLHATPEQCMERIKLRGTASEQGMPLDYLRALYACYFNLVMCMVEAGVRVRLCDWSSLPGDADLCAVVQETLRAPDDADMFASLGQLVTPRLYRSPAPQEDDLKNNVAICGRRRSSMSHMLESALDGPRVIAIRHLNEVSRRSHEVLRYGVAETSARSEALQLEGMANCAQFVLGNLLLGTACRIPRLEDVDGWFDAIAPQDGEQ